VTSRPVTRWFCADCERWTDKPPTLCAEQGHAVASARKTQFAFRCAHCARRAHAYDKLFVAPCGNCGHMRWEPCSVFAAADRATKPAAGGLAPAMVATESVQNSLRSFGATLTAAHDLASTGDVAR
jgi:hypothetical protein